MPEDETRVAALQNEVEGWRRLALRLLNQGPMMGPIVGDPNAELSFGALPDHLPYTLPIPSDSRIVGSVAYGAQTAIYLDMDRSPDEVWQFYRERMQAPEWEVIEPQRPQGGFVPTMPGLGLLFCRGPAGPSLTVHARYEDATTEVMLLLVNDPRRSRCPPEPEYNRLRDAPKPDHNRPWERLPALFAPPKAMMHPTGIGSGPYHQFSQADLDTELDLGAITDHFAGQLERAGWTNRDGGQSGPAAFSAWTVEPGGGETGPGLFVALRTDEGTPNRYFLFLRAGSV